MVGLENFRSTCYQQLVAHSLAFFVHILLYKTYILYAFRNSNFEVAPVSYFVNVVQHSHMTVICIWKPLVGKTTCSVAHPRLSLKQV